MKSFCLAVLSLVIIGKSFSQDLSVPDDILERLISKEIVIEEDTFLFRVAYPANYNPSQSYQCYLGLSGGSQSLEIVDYCYAAWFQSGYFANYITILPVNTKKSLTSFVDYDSARIAHMITAIDENFPLEEKWKIGGTSNGGIAAFDFVAMDPDRYDALIVAPGMIKDSINFKNNWKHIDVILAYGDKDLKSWIKSSKEAAKTLKTQVKSVKLVPLKNQGHILPISFNVDRIYDEYFLID